MKRIGSVAAHPRSADMRRAPKQLPCVRPLATERSIIEPSRLKNRRHRRSRTVATGAMTSARRVPAVRNMVSDELPVTALIAFPAVNLYLAISSEATKGIGPMVQRAGQLGLTGRWAIFASGLDYNRLPSELLPVLKALLLDTVGVALAASTLGDCSREIARVVRDAPGAPECTLLGYGGRVSCLMAALANGALAHSLNFDAVGLTGGHIGVATVPSPLIMAEKRGGITGRDFLVAMATGAEFTTRLAKSLSTSGKDIHKKFLEGQILGYFGASLGAGRVCGFTPDRMHNLLGIALMQASGTRQVSIDGGAAKAMAGGFANHGAVLAVLLAEQGIDAKCATLEGPAGLFAMFYDGIYESSIMEEGLGDQFFAAETMFKPWPTSGILHPFIEACLDLHKRQKVEPAAITGIHVKAGLPSKAWLEPAEQRRHPLNGATAANSIFFAVAKTLANGTLTLSDFTAEGLREPATRRLAQSMTYEIDDALGSGAVVQVKMSDGSILEASARAERRAVSFDQLVAKFRLCVRHAARPLPDADIDDFIDRVDNLEKLTDMRKLMAPLARGAGSL